MPTNRQPATLPQFKALAREIAPVAYAVCMAQAFAECERERVNAYILPIFQSYGFVYGELGERCGVSGPITDPKDLYLCGDDVMTAAYFAECDRAHKAHGSTLPQNHCPVLTAESLLIQAENALIDLARPVFGIGIEHIHGDDRRKYLDLLIGAGLKARDDMQAEG